MSKNHAARPFTRRVIHLVPQFHYDIEYLLPHDPYLEVSFENLRAAYELLRKHPEYTYLVEQVYLLEQFFREYPSLLAGFRKCSAEERLDIAPGMYAMADMNMPSGESLLRQLAVGKRWCADNGFREPAVLNTADCAGHPAQMPQIARHAGYKYYVFVRSVDTAERSSEILWHGLDGTVLRTYWLAGGYVGWKPVNTETGRPSINLPVTLDAAVAKALKHGLSQDVLLPHGGDFQRPFARGPALVQEWNRAHPESPVLYSTYARALARMDWRRAPAHTGEWNPSHAGCYSSRIRIKQGNRECEALLRTAEAASALARLRLNVPPDADGLRHAWKLAFLNQFHDTIWGTILDSAYAQALDRIARVRMVTKEMIESRLAPFLPRPGRKSSRPLLAFNPLPWPRRVTVDLPVKERVRAVPGNASDHDGLTLDLPPCGFRLVDAGRVKRPAGRSPFSCTTPARSSGNAALRIVTPFYKTVLAASGVVSSLVRRSDGLQLVDPERPWFNALCCQTDQGDLWQCYEGPIFDGGERRYEADLVRDPYPLERQFTRSGRRALGMVTDNRQEPAARIEVKENSPHRLVIAVEGELCRYWPTFREFNQYGLRILYRTAITFHADTPRIDFHLSTQHERGRCYRLRAAFFTDMRGGVIEHEVPFGLLKRPEGEFPAQNFVLLHDERKGLALFNRGLPGNNVTDGVMMLSLMRSVSFNVRAESDLAFEEGQTHEFDYAILPFGEKAEMAKLQFARMGAEFVTPPYLLEPPVAPDAGGSRRATDSLLRLDPASVVCTAIYPDGNRLVIRLYESAGRAVEARLRLNLPLSSAAETDALLRRAVRLKPSRGALRLAFRPFEIKTIVIQ